MDRLIDTKTLKKMDPIWKRLRTDRFWAFLDVLQDAPKNAIL